jgi:hypothetical protein
MANIIDGKETLGVERSATLELNKWSPITEAVEAPLRKVDDSYGALDAVIPDDDAEIVLKRIHYESDGAGSFLIEDGDGNAKTPSYAYTATPGKVIGVADVGMGAGQSCYIRPTVTSGTLRIYVETEIRRNIANKKATAYPDA